MKFAKIPPHHSRITHKGGKEEDGRGGGCIHAHIGKRGISGSSDRTMIYLAIAFQSNGDIVVVHGGNGTFRNVSYRCADTAEQWTVSL